MSFFNLYKLTVRDARLGCPALSTDITDGFFKFSLLGGKSSTKDETIYADVVGCLVVDDSIWEVYEAQNGDPVFCHRASQRAYNALTDFVVTNQRDTWTIELIKDGNIESNRQVAGLQITDGRNLRAVNITEFVNV